MMKKVNFSEYEEKYDERIKERLEKDPGSVDVETMRENLYGYTFTKAYADGEIKETSDGMIINLNEIVKTNHNE